MKSLFILSAFAVLAQASLAADCSSKVENAAIKKCNDGCFVEDSAHFVRTTSTGKDEYLVTVANAGTSFEEKYAVYTKAGSCTIENVVLLDHE
jgi:hypothetical protein